MRLRMLLTILIVMPASAWAQDWCVDGAVDARRYFFRSINRVEGQSAADWEAVLRASGLPSGPPPGVPPNRGVHQGISQQIGASGPRGRLMLPTSSPDGLGYFAREADILADANGGVCWQNPAFCAWTWKENVSQPPYAPNACVGQMPSPVPIPPVTAPPPVHVPPPVFTNREILDAIERVHLDLSAQNRMLAEKIDEPAWITKVLGNRYVQMALAATGTWLTQRELAK